MQTIEIEFHQLDQKYAGLSILDPKEQARLMAALADQGQQSPVLVISAGQDRYVLIDGYRRAAALYRLGRDTVKALVVPMSELEALLMKHRMESQRKRSALEEAWLLRELNETHGMSQEELAVKLNRSRSWVCRRLALVGVLSEKVQESIRKGKISPQAAMKYLVPLSRGNPEECEQMVNNIGGQRLSVRQVGKLYLGWRTGDLQQKTRIIENPLLYLRVNDELSRSEPPLKTDETEAQSLFRDIEIIGSVCWRARGRIRHGCLKISELGAHLQHVWKETCHAFETLSTLLGRKEKNAG